MDQEVAEDFEEAVVASEEARAEADFTAVVSTEEASTVAGTTDLFSAVGGLALDIMVAVDALAD